MTLKKLITLIAASIFCLNTFAQDKIANASSEKSTLILPKFKIMNIVDSVKFTEEDLAKKKKSIFIYFGADCGHCTYFAKKMMDSLSLFENTQIIMVSSSEFARIKKFSDDAKLSLCPFITVGRDGDYFFMTHFEIRQFPTAIVYDKKGKFLKRFESEISIADLANDKKQ